ncbi:metal-dependent phosphohydrolase [Nocardia sp. alder85J]|uniref:HD domain-containing protein n=1 Tax=Nocardia sp. alder85J TaxID=2862949 RepID=UPI001CD5EE40|nr:metal-dependent phosphohydrolase [Nocardia sp. alder85J]MCX4098235.1 metal-dependent phosphohydrolase [Nocardia sp. alder85J]
MTELDAELLDRWQLLAGPRADALGTAVIRCYRQPHRRYHTGRHLRSMLWVVDELAAAAVDLEAVRYAAFFHDAVYAVQRGDNEERSARLADSALSSLGVRPDTVAEVVRLIRLTAAHTPAGEDGNGAVLCDADLAVLGASEAEYAAYARAVRAEYRHVPTEWYRQGRAAVLRRFIDRPVLFRTVTARERFESRARDNLAQELRSLQPLSPAG